MGWNSWDSYGTTVTEAEVKANAEYMARNLRSHGWQYVVIDIQWYEPNARAHGYRPNAELTMDEYGRLTPAVNRFPSAAGGRGFKPLADTVHALGLKLGIHILRGIPRQAVKSNLPVAGTDARAADIADPQSICRWNTDMYGVDMRKHGAREYYDGLAKMYAGWGIDYIKADDEGAPLYREEIAALHGAMERSGRPMVLSISPGPARVEDADFLAANAELWRVSDDLWDRWQDLQTAFDLLPRWAPYARPGAWPDGDMLPLGHIGLRAERGNDRMSLLTHDEQRTLMSLWSIARSPLMLGGDLPTSDAFTLGLISNDEVLAADQKADHSRQLFRRGDHVAWTSDVAGSADKYLAVFNTGEDGETPIPVRWSDLGMAGRVTIRDLWERNAIGVFPEGHSFRIPPHGAGLYRLSAAEER
jgi:alpha-galactosidase